MKIPSAGTEFFHAGGRWGAGGRPDRQEEANSSF